MNNKDLQILIQQTKNIIQNKPSLNHNQFDSDDLNELQEMLNYLGNSINEANCFLNEIAMGNLNATVPSRNNYLASSIKQLHANLRHLTWQADQVSKGDYNQSISFLGEFSNSFNRMVEQLSEREAKVKLQSQNLIATNNLMISVMDSLKDWIVVVNSKNGEIIYLNKAAEKVFVDDIDDGLKDEILSLLNDKNITSKNFDYMCKQADYIINIKIFDVQWSETLANVYHITDVTQDKQQIEKYEVLAFKDDLTGLHNRRYCINEVKRLIDLNQKFSFCLIDIDYLKLANDQYGHLAGDEYLKKVTEEMGKVVRATDSICRIGGDEFGIIFPNCCKELIVKKMLNINEKLLKSSSQYPMSISFGVYEVNEFNHVSFKSILKKADELMYLNKDKRK